MSRPQSNTAMPQLPPLAFDKHTSTFVDTAASPPSPEPRASSSFVFPTNIRASSDSEGGYPSWLPRRPGPPPPSSSHGGGEFRSSAEESSGTSPAIDDAVAQLQGRAPHGRKRVRDGRNPTLRSVRIVSMPTEEEEAAMRAALPRQPTPVFGRGTAPLAPSTPLTPSSAGAVVGDPPPLPRFRAPGLHLELLRSPSIIDRIHFYSLPLIVFAHVPIQAYFDFNAAYILLQVSRHPSNAAPGVRGSGRNWALAAAAYFACFFIWFFVVFIGHDLIYSFYRRWRVKRPLIAPIYLSASAFNLASMTSYSTFCFLQHVRHSAWKPSQNGSLRDGIAEACYRFSQNMPTVTLLIPRAALCLTLLLSFWGSQPLAVASGNAGTGARDGTFFHGDDGSLTSYAKGVLITSIAWTVWRAVVLLASWLGLWILSEQGCAGVCGPRYRWEEADDDEKNVGANSPSLVDKWGWRGFTETRIQEAFEFCLTSRRTRWSATRLSKAPEPATVSESLREKQPFRFPATPTTPGTFTFPAASSLFPPLDQVMLGSASTSKPLAASQSSPQRRSVLGDEVFAPVSDPVGTLPVPALAPPIPGTSGGGSLVPLFTADAGRQAGPSSPPSSTSGPVLSLPFPFFPTATSTTPTTPYASTSQSLPFPLQVVPKDNSPRKPRVVIPERKAAAGGDVAGAEEEEDVEGEDEEGDDYLDLGEDGDYTGEISIDSEGNPISTGPETGSMSSLGHPVGSRYPFMYRTPVRRGSRSTNSGSHRTPHTKSSSSHAYSSAPSSRPSGSSPRHDSILESPEPSAGSPMSLMLPPPPRHPGTQRRRRAGTVPSMPSSPVPSDSSSRSRTRAFSTTDQTFGVNNPLPPVQGMDDNEHSRSEDDTHGEYETAAPSSDAHGSQEEAEKEDSVGLLSSGPSPKSSYGALRHRAGSLVSLHRRTSFASGSGSGSGSPSSTSIRSRAASLVPGRGRNNSSTSIAGPHIQITGEGTISGSTPSSRASSLARGTAETASRYSDARTHATPSQDDEDDNTFGIPPDWNDVPRLQPRMPPTTGESSGSRLRPQASELTVSQAPHPDISEAPSSYITAAPSMGTTTGSSGGTVRTAGPWDPYRDVMRPL